MVDCDICINISESLIHKSSFPGQSQTFALLPTESLSSDGLIGVGSLILTYNQQEESIKRNFNGNVGTIIQTQNAAAAHKRSKPTAFVPETANTKKKQTLVSPALKKEPAPSFKQPPLMLPSQPTDSSSSPDFSSMFAECVLAGEKVFMCAVCSYKAKFRGNMVRHVKLMHGESKLKCSTCGNSFGEKYKLKLHYMKVHNLQESVAKAAAETDAR